MSILFLMLSYYTFSQTNFELGKQYFVAEEWGKAISCFQKVIAENNDNYEAIELRGEAYAHLKNWDASIEDFQLLKEKFPEKANYWYKFGGVMAMKAKESSKWIAFSLVDDIEKAFLKATQLDDKHIDARWALITLYIELPAIIGGSEKKAQKYADELMVLSKVDGYLAKGYIDVYFERYNKAEINYKNAHKIGNSKTTFQKLYDLYLNEIKNTDKANQLKKEFNGS